MLKVHAVLITEAMLQLKWEHYVEEGLVLMFSMPPGLEDEKKKSNIMK